MNAIWTISGVMALLTAGAVMPVDDGTAVEALMEQFEEAVAQAAQDVRFLPLEPSDAYGQTDGGRIHSVAIVVRVASPIALDDLLVMHGGYPLDFTVEQLRGEDDGVADKGDLVRIDIAMPMTAGQEIDLVLEAPGARAAQWSFTAPKNLAPQIVSVDVSARPL